MNSFNFLEARNLYSFNNTKPTVISQHQFKKKITSILFIHNLNIQ